LTAVRGQIPKTVSIHASRVVNYSIKKQLNLELLNFKCWISANVRYPFCCTSNQDTCIASSCSCYYKNVGPITGSRGQM